MSFLYSQSRSVQMNLQCVKCGHTFMQPTSQGYMWVMILVVFVILGRGHYPMYRTVQDPAPLARTDLTVQV